jgi:hypothetical protein
MRSQTNLVRLVKVLTATLEAAAGQLIAELCAASERIDDKRRIAVLKKQLQTTSASAGRWHMAAMEYRAMLDLRDGPTVELELPDETFHVQPLDKRSVN